MKKQNDKLLWHSCITRRKFFCKNTLKFCSFWHFVLYKAVERYFKKIEETLIQLLVYYLNNETWQKKHSYICQTNFGMHQGKSWMKKYYLWGKAILASQGSMTPLMLDEKKSQMITLRNRHFYRFWIWLSSFPYFEIFRNFQDVDGAKISTKYQETSFSSVWLLFV